MTSPAIDLDTPSVISYSLNTTSGSPFSLVDEATPTLRLTTPLQYENASLYTGLLTATDDGTPPLTSTLTFYIEVSDVTGYPTVNTPQDHFSGR